MGFGGEDDGGWRVKLRLLVAEEFTPFSSPQFRAISENFANSLNKMAPLSLPRTTMATTLYSGLRLTASLNSFSYFSIYSSMAEISMRLIHTVLHWAAMRGSITVADELGQISCLYAICVNKLKSKLPIVASYNDATDGLVTHGWISKLKQHGCFVKFYNGVQGFGPSFPKVVMPRNLLSEDGNLLFKMFKVRDAFSNDGHNDNRRSESSFDENNSFSKYEKEKPDLMEPVKDLIQYKEYVQEYTEKYSIYCSLNKVLENYKYL